MEIAERSLGFAIDSRKLVLEHPKFKEIFEPYAEAMGINQEQDVAEWAGFRERQAKRDEEKKVAAEKKRIAEEERKAREAAEAEKHKLEAGKEAMKAYFKMIKERDLLKYVGQPDHAKKALKRLQA
jgi:hypothetical protein